MFGDKDVRGFIETIEPIADVIIITEAISPRAMSVDELFAVASEIVDTDKLEKAHDLPAALDRAIHIADEASANDDQSVGIVVTGSVVTAAQARALLGKKRA
jgi:dihydrofolate synthase/folylpolyglutamate synthase